MGNYLIDIDKLYFRISENYDLGTTTFTMATSTHYNIIEIGLYRVSYGTHINSLRLVKKLGNIYIKGHGSPGAQFDVSAIEYLLSKGVKFDLYYCIRTAARMEHIGLIKLLISYGAILTDFDIELLLNKGIDIKKYFYTSAFNNITRIAERI